MMERRQIFIVLTCYDDIVEMFHLTDIFQTKLFVKRHSLGIGVSPVVRVAFLFFIEVIAYEAVRSFGR